MRQIVYVSESTDPGNVSQIDSIILQTRHNNALDGLTGLLWVCGNRFLQVMEGPSEVLAPTFERIAADPRHCNLHTLLDRAIEAPEFRSWTIMFRHEAETERELNDRVRQKIAGNSAPVRACFESLLVCQ